MKFLHAAAAIIALYPTTAASADIELKFANGNSHTCWGIESGACCSDGVTTEVEQVNFRNLPIEQGYSVYISGWDTDFGCSVNKRVNMKRTQQADDTLVGGFRSASFGKVPQPATHEDTQSSVFTKQEVETYESQLEL